MYNKIYSNKINFFITIFPQQEVAEERALRTRDGEACGFFFLWLLSFFLHKEKESNITMDARTYDPETGSFLQSDPFNIATSQLPAPAQGIAAMAMGYEMQMLTNPHQFMSYGLNFCITRVGSFQARPRWTFYLVAFTLIIARIRYHFFFDLPTCHLFAFLYEYFSY